MKGRREKLGGDRGVHEGMCVGVYVHMGQACMSVCMCMCRCVCTHRVGIHLKTSGPKLERTELTKYTHMYIHTFSHTQTHIHTHKRISRKEEKLITC